MQLGQPGVEGPKLLGNGPSLRIVVQTAFECALPVFDFGLNVRNLATNGTWNVHFPVSQVIPGDNLAYLNGFQAETNEGIIG